MYIRLGGELTGYSTPPRRKCLTVFSLRVQRDIWG